MTPTPGRNPTLLPRTPRRNQQLLPKLSKRPPDHPQNIPIFWNEDSFNRPGQPRGNITPTSAPPTGFELQLYIFYLKSFRSICFAPRHPLLRVYNGNRSKIISTNFQKFVFGHPPSNNCAFVHNYSQFSVLILMRAEADHLIALVNNAENLRHSSFLKTVFASDHHLFPRAHR